MPTMEYGAYGQHRNETEEEEEKKKKKKRKNGYDRRVLQKRLNGGKSNDSSY